MMIKKLFILLFILTSCSNSKNDSQVMSTKNLIIGKDEIVEIENGYGCAGLAIFKMKTDSSDYIRFLVIDSKRKIGDMKNKKTYIDTDTAFSVSVLEYEKGNPFQIPYCTCIEISNFQKPKISNLKNYQVTIESVSFETDSATYKFELRAKKNNFKLYNFEAKMAYSTAG